MYYQPRPSDNSYLDPDKLFRISQKPHPITVTMFIITYLAWHTSDKTQMKTCWCFIWCSIKIHPPDPNGRHLLAFDFMNN